MIKKRDKKIFVQVEVSSRHVHLSKEDFEKLFGKNQELKVLRNLSQPGEFASDKCVTLIEKDKKIENVRVVGGFRERSQVEIPMTDAYNLKLKPLPKIKISGDLKGTRKILVNGQFCSLNLPCIIAKRHIHLSEEDSKKLKIKNNQKVSIKIDGERKLVFNEVVARVSKKYKTSVHLDTDEGNAAGIKNKSLGEIVL